MKSKIEVGSALYEAGKYFKSNNLYNTFWYSVMRFFNYLFLILFVLAIVCSSSGKGEFTMEFSYLLLIFVASPIIAYVIIHISKNKHKFQIWDKVEREKYESFTKYLTLLVFFFTYISMFIFSFTINNYYKIETFDRGEIIALSIGIFYSVLFIANAVFSIQLYYGVYADDLIQDDLIAKKPTNWEWDSREVKPSYF